MQRLRERCKNTPANSDKAWETDARKRVRQWDKYRYIELMKKAKEHDRVVELGCGCSEFPFFLKNQRPSCEVHGLDFSPYAIREMKWYAPQILYRLGNAVRTGYQADYFDVVIAGEILEHLENPELLIQEMKRIWDLHTLRVELHDLPPQWLKLKISVSDWI